MLGCPDTQDWPELKSYPNYPIVQKYEDVFYRCRLKERFPTLSDSGIDFMKQLLEYNPRKRISVGSFRRFHDRRNKLCVIHGSTRNQFLKTVGSCPPFLRERVLLFISLFDLNTQVKLRICKSWNDVNCHFFRLNSTSDSKRRHTEDRQVFLTL